MPLPSIKHQNNNLHPWFYSTKTHLQHHKLPKKPRNLYNIHQSLPFLHCNLIRSRLSDTILILGRTSGSTSVQFSAIWNAATICTFACTSCKSPWSIISDKGRSSLKTFLTMLSSPFPSSSGPASGTRPVRISKSTIPKE